MNLSVIIPVSRDTRGLTTTLQSIKEQQWDSSRIEVVVCNDGGGSPISDIAAEFGCIEARLDENRGSYAARNAGLGVARGRALAFVDADEVVTHGWLDAGLAALNEADYVGGRIVIETGPAPSFWESVDAKYAFPVESYIARSRFAPTANLFVSRHVFQQLGGFDESLKSGGDQEFGMRAYRQGFVQMYCREAVVRHPPREFREQIRKARRTASGKAQLEVVLWKKPVAKVTTLALLSAGSRLLRSALLAARHLIRGTTRRPDRELLLASARAVVDACFFACLSASAAAFAFRRQGKCSSIPRIQ